MTHNSFISPFSVTFYYRLNFTDIIIITIIIIIIIIINN